MRRPLLALLLAALGVASLATPAAATETTEIVVGRPDGSFTVDEVPTASLGAALAEVRRRPGVAWAEVNATFSADKVTPNDPLYPQQWGPVRTRTDEAWTRATGDSSVVVAVVDSGVDPNHPDLAGNLLPGADFVNDGLSGDPSGHGTGVAGVVAARGNDGSGMAGYCWSCKILPVRVLDEDGNGSSAAIANGVNWAATHGADIINLSLSGDRSSTTLDVAIASARARGILVVAAAGNRTRSGQNLSLPQYPAASEGVIGVVATDPTDAAYPWTFRGTWADVTAPGCAVTLTVGGGHAEQCGTSFAAPAVSGILGLALGGFGKAPAATVEAELLTTSAALGGGIASRGRVDAGALVAKLASLFPTQLVPERVAGANRVATAVALSKRSFAAADTVVLARSDAFVDALLAAPLAGRYGAPVLLTGVAALDPTVLAEIRRLGATTVLLVGDGLSAAVDASLAGAGIANRPRLGGATPADLAARIATELGSRSAYVASASAWPDAVSVSGLAALTKAPILLVQRDAVPAATRQALTSLGVDDVTIVGGAGVVGTPVEAALAAPGRTVRRLAGASRYETSRLVATAATAAGAESKRTWLATGGDWPDALAAGPASAAKRATLLLVDGKNASGTTTVLSWLRSSSVQELVLVGGEASITGSSASALAAALVH